MAAKAEPAKPPRKRYVARLDRVEGVRREIAKLVREAIRGERDSIDTHRIGQTLYLISRLLEASELEKRIETLEKAASWKQAA